MSAPGPQHPQSTPAALLQAALRADPSRPLITFYDDATGERTELSVATFDNWVAKTANLLQDGLALEPGARVRLQLPVHWQAAVWLSACWAAGMVVVPAPQDAAATGEDEAPGDDGGDDAEVVVTSLDALQEREPAGPTNVDPAPIETVALALRPLGLPGADVPDGVLDYDIEIRAYADRFAPCTRVPPTSPALVISGERLTAHDLAAAAATQAAAWQLDSADRLLVSVPLLTRTGILAGLLAPLAAGASVVLCRRLSPAALPARLTSERVTTVVRPLVIGDPGEDAGEQEADVEALSRQGLIAADLRAV